jgi:hypothetical protein
LVQESTEVETRRHENTESEREDTETRTSERAKRV